MDTTKLLKLLEKARQKQITCQEVKELKRVLEEQKRKREESGDIGGAILLGWLLLIVLNAFRIH